MGVLENRSGAAQRENAGPGPAALDRLAAPSAPALERLIVATYTALFRELHRTPFEHELSAALQRRAAGIGGDELRLFIQDSNLSERGRRLPLLSDALLIAAAAFVAGSEGRPPGARRLADYLLREYQVEITPAALGRQYRRIQRERPKQAPTVEREYSAYDAAQLVQMGLQVEQAFRTVSRTLRCQGLSREPTYTEVNRELRSCRVAIGENLFRRLVHSQNRILAPAAQLRVYQSAHRKRDALELTYLQLRSEKQRAPTGREIESRLAEQGLGGFDVQRGLRRINRERRRERLALLKPARPAAFKIDRRLLLQAYEQCQSQSGSAPSRRDLAAAYRRLAPGRSFNPEVLGRTLQELRTAERPLPLRGPRKLDPAAVVEAYQQGCRFLGRPPSLAQLARALSWYYPQQACSRDALKWVAAKLRREGRALELQGKGAERLIMAPEVLSQSFCQPVQGGELTIVRPFDRSVVVNGQRGGQLVGRPSFDVESDELGNVLRDPRRPYGAIVRSVQRLLFQVPAPAPSSFPVLERLTARGVELQAGRAPKFSLPAETLQGLLVFVQEELLARVNLSASVRTGMSAIISGLCCFGGRRDRPCDPRFYLQAALRNPGRFAIKPAGGERVSALGLLEQLTKIVDRLQW